MRGTTLIEVLIALAAAVVVITTVTISGISSLKNVQFAKDQDRTTKYAQEGMELMRKIRNTNYIAFRSYSGVYCLNDNQTALGAVVSSCTTPNIDSQYIRSVQIQQGGGCGANLAQVTISVAWTDSKCAANTFCHVSRITSCFSTVNPVPAP